MAQEQKPRAAAGAKTSAKKAAKKKAVRKKPRPKASGPVDLQMVREVLELMESHQVAEFEVEQEGVRLKLRKAGAEAPHVPQAPAVAHPPPPPRTDPAHEPAVESVANTNPVKSPMVGTFYRSPSPDSDVFVKVGDVVDEDSVVCIIEAMKVMNEIKAEASGEIVQALVENGETVEYGQPLFLLKPA